jgi:hypothetical protein
VCRNYTQAARQLGLEPARALGECRIYGRFPTIAGGLVPDDAGEASKPSRIVSFKCAAGEASKPSRIMSFKCAQRWRAKRRRVRMVTPDDRLSDMNGVLLVDGG